MKTVDTISVDKLSQIANKMYGSLVKAVVDLRKYILAIDAEMHADLEQYLLEQGSKQNDLWGINLYPAKFGTDDFIEFDSMINIRPSQKNMTRGIDNQAVRKRIIKLVNSKVLK